MALEITEELSAILKPLVRTFEGLKLEAYRDPVGLWTIGYGHRCTADQKDITLQEAEDLLHKDCTVAYNQLIQKSPQLISETEGRKAALTDFIFNLGVERYSTSTLKKKIDLSDWPGAHQELLRWVVAGGKKLDGLVRRRTAEALLLGV